MKSMIRRDRRLTWQQQMTDREMDAQRSRMHPNGIANTERQRAESRARREEQARAKAASRASRSVRRKNGTRLPTAARSTGANRVTARNVTFATIVDLSGNMVLCSPNVPHYRLHKCALLEYDQRTEEVLAIVP